jgi:hypothetical protein
MQTFLPYESFTETARVLDYRRLNSQRREAHGIIKILSGESKGKGWINHPAVKMWEGYDEMLKLYFNVIVKEWVDRGYVNNYEYFDIDETKLVSPWWLGDKDFHRAMRSRLIEKNEDFYLPKFPKDKGFNDGKYFWPVNLTKTYRII